MKKKNRTSGFSLAEVLIAMGIGAVLVVGTAAVMAWNAKSQARSLELQKLAEFKQELLANLSSDAAWSNTLRQAAQSGGSLGCVMNLVPCEAGPGVPWTNQLFTLYDVNNRVFFDGTDPTAGLTDRGTRCNSVTDPPGYTVNGNDRCPFRYDLRWSAVCNGANCTNPQILVNAKLHYSPSPTSTSRVANQRDEYSKLNSDRYSIENFYPSPGPCAAQTALFAEPGTYNFRVPANFRRLSAEIWSAGGGGAAMDSDCNGSPGQPGGNSSFGAFSVPGGSGGEARAEQGLSWRYFCTEFNGNSFCGFAWFNANHCGATGSNVVGFPPQLDPNCSPSGKCWGGDGRTAPTPPPPPPAGIPPEFRMCSGTVGLSAGLGGRPFSANGSMAGGGGAGTNSVRWVAIPPCGCLCNKWCTLTVDLVQARGGGADVDIGGGTLRWIAGGYNQQMFTPLTLVPGSVVTVVVGNGGDGGRVGTLNGGRGAPGMVKITWW